MTLAAISVDFLGTDRLSAAEAVVDARAAAGIRDAWVVLCAWLVYLLFAISLRKLEDSVVTMAITLATVAIVLTLFIISFFRRTTSDRRLLFCTGLRGATWLLSLIFLISTIILSALVVDGLGFGSLHIHPLISRLFLSGDSEGLLMILILILFLPVAAVHARTFKNSESCFHECEIFIGKQRDAEQAWSCLLSYSIPGAAYNAQAHYIGLHPPLTPRDDLVAKVSEWMKNNRSNNVCWLTHSDNTQLSSVAQHIAAFYATEKRLLSSIFLSDDTRFILPTIAFQIATSSPSSRSMILEALEDQLQAENPGFTFPFSPHDAIMKLIINPVRVQTIYSPPMIIVIDAIQTQSLNDIMLLSNALRDHHMAIQIFITSHPSIFEQVIQTDRRLLDHTRSLYVGQSVIFDSWVTVDKQPKVYQHLVSLLLDAIQMKRNREGERLWSSLHKHLELAASLDSVSSLLESHRIRVKLLQMLSGMHMSDHPSIRDALDKDDAGVLNILQQILSSDADKKSILELQGEDARNVVNLIQLILDRRPYKDDENGGRAGEIFRHQAHRLLVKLSEVSGILPASVSITGVTLLQRDRIFCGGFSDIYQGAYNGQIVALKRIRIFRDQSDEDQRRHYQMFCREALVWQHLTHPHVVPFLGVDAETFPSSLCLVSPWMRHGTIIDHMKQNGPLAYLSTEKYVLEVAQGLEYLHSQNVVHGDLRGGNILINGDWRACLTDFGLTAFVEADTSLKSSNRNGSLRWMAPELLEPSAFGLRFRRTSASDVYAFACVCCEIYSRGLVPFSEISSEISVMFGVMNEKRPRRPSDQSRGLMPDSLWDLVQRCWKQQPSGRPSISEVVDIMVSSGYTQDG